MNYYDELLETINNLIAEGDNKKALKLIDSELSMPYVPRDVEDKLHELLYDLKHEEYTKGISEDKIEEYLFSSPEQQILAVDKLNNSNIRDYIELIEKYLKSDGYKDAKALLIDSMIRQEINHEFTIVNDGLLYTFNPVNMVEVTQTQGYKSTVEVLNELYMKEPSKLIFAKQMLYRKALLMLPNTIDVDNAHFIAEEISKLIDYAFK